MATIKLTNDVLVHSSNLQYAIDPANILLSRAVESRNQTYTATQDCWAIVFGYCIRQNGLLIDDEPLFLYHSSQPTDYGDWFILHIPLKKGQTLKYDFTMANGRYQTLKVFGCK